MLHGGQDRPSRQDGALAVLDLGDLVGLPPVPVRAAQRRDRAGVVEERVRVGQLGPEPELVGDVRLGVAVVVDVDLIQHVVAEGVEVRAAGRALERDVVRDQGDGARAVRADERVDVGAVGYRVLWRSPGPRDAMTLCYLTSV